MRVWGGGRMLACGPARHERGAYRLMLVRCRSKGVLVLRRAVMCLRPLPVSVSDVLCCGHSLDCGAWVGVRAFAPAICPQLANAVDHIDCAVFLVHSSVEYAEHAWALACPRQPEATSTLGPVAVA